MRSILTPMAALTVAIAASIASPAAASGDQVNIAIPTHDLNLTSAAGQRALQGRINRAARQICETGVRGVRAQARETACMADMRNQAEAQLPGSTTIALTAPRPRG